MLEPTGLGDSDEYPQSIFWIKNIKISIPLYTPKVDFNGVLILWTGFPDGQFN